MIRVRHALTYALAAGLFLPAAASAEERPTLELSLEEAVERALENNVDIAVERFNPMSSEEAVRQAKGAYDPFVTSRITQSSRTSPAANVFAGAEEVQTDTTVFNFGATQNLPTGGSLRVDFNNEREETNSIFATFNPNYGSTFNASLTQPLLRDFRVDFNRQQIRVAKKSAEISDLQFRQTVTNTLATVKNRYFDLIAAIDNLEAQLKSLALAKKLLDENRIKVQVGTLAPLDVVAAESEVASREEGVIVAENQLAEAEDALKRAIFPANTAETWALRVVPRDRPSAEPVPVDVAAALEKALAQRTDVQSARKSLESAGYSLEFDRNQTLPALDLVASYGSVGIGGTQIEREGFGGPIVRVIDGGYGDAVGDVFGFDFPTWTIGVNVTVPIRNRTAEANAARSRLARDQAEANLRRLELQVASEVRSAARAVETNFKRVASTRAARVLQERRLDAEEKKFAAGMSTNFLVTQAQRDLALAEVAELRATADYRKSIVEFERVQEAGIGGTGASLTVSARSGFGSTADGSFSDQGGGF